MCDRNTIDIVTLYGLNTILEFSNPSGEAYWYPRALPQTWDDLHMRVEDWTAKVRLSGQVFPGSVMSI